MSKLITSLVAVSVSLTGAFAWPGVSMLEDRSTSSNFSLFAYGSDEDSEIGGFPIFYHSGYAFIADPVRVDYAQNYVTFQKNTSDTTQWIATPLYTNNDTWADSVFYVPVGSGAAGFYKEAVTDDVTESNIISTGFKLYGSTAMVNIDSTLETQWYAVNTTTDGLWSVGWNATGGDVTDAQLISLRKVTGGNVNYPKF